MLNRIEIGTLTSLLSSSHFLTSWAVCFGSLSIWKTHLLIPPGFTVGMVFSDLQASPFSSKCNGGHYARPQDTSPKIKIFFPVCICNLFLCVCVCVSFWAMAELLAERPFSPCQYSTHFTVDNDTPASAIIFTRSFVFALGLIRTVLNQIPISGTQNLSHSWADWLMAGHSHVVYIYVELFELKNVAPSGTLKLHPRMNQTCASPRFCPKSWLISTDFPMLLHKEALCLRSSLKYTAHRCVSN